FSRSSRTSVSRLVSRPCTRASGMHNSRNTPGLSVACKSGRIRSSRRNSAIFIAAAQYTRTRRASQIDARARRAPGAYFPDTAEMGGFDKGFETLVADDSETV